VDIFAAHGDGVAIAEENLDECVFCELCLDASPPGAVRVVSCTTAVPRSSAS
jgi:hypothetical protein